MTDAECGLPGSYGRRFPIRLSGRSSSQSAQPPPPDVVAARLSEARAIISTYSLSTASIHGSHQFVGLLII